MYIRKYYRQFITLFLTLVLVSGTFSVLTSAEETAADYDPNWDLSLYDYDLILHLSEENYSFLMSGHTEKSIMSLERLGWTPEEAQENLDNTGALMEIFPESARDKTDYIIYLYNLGYYEAPFKTLKRINEDADAAETFRQSLLENNFPSNRLPVLSYEGPAEIGGVVWYVYSASMETGEYFRTYVTVLNNTILWLDLKYWDTALQDEMTAVMEDILGNTSLIIHADTSSAMPDFNPGNLQTDSDFTSGIQSMIADLQDAYEYTYGKHSASDSSYDCIRKYPFYMQKEKLQAALEEENLEIYKGTNPDVDELYVLRDLNDGSTWQMIYELDDKGQLVSVTMPLIAEKTAEAFTGPFCHARDFYQQELGVYETEDQDAMEQMLQDPEAFMDSVISDHNHVMLYWKDAYTEGAGLYLNYTNLEGRPAVFTVYVCPGYYQDEAGK